MIAALQSTLSAKDLELEVNMKYILLWFYIVLLPQWAQRKRPNLWLPPHSTPQKFENAALFLRGLGLPSTLIPHENEAFRQPCVLVRTENILKTEVLENDDWPNDNHVISLSKFFLDRNPK